MSCRIFYQLHCLVFSKKQGVRTKNRNQENLLVRSCLNLEYSQLQAKQFLETLSQQTLATLSCCSNLKKHLILILVFWSRYSCLDSP